jgi:hypothetical protein
MAAARQQSPQGPFLHRAVGRLQSGEEDGGRRLVAGLGQDLEGQFESAAHSSAHLGRRCRETLFQALIKLYDAQGRRVDFCPSSSASVPQNAAGTTGTAGEIRNTKHEIRNHFESRNPNAPNESLPLLVLIISKLVP